MKNKILISIIAFTAFVFAGCNGDHSTRVVMDTVNNRYGADTANAAKSSVDTGKINSTDKSASGGTKTAQDSTKQATPNK